MAIAQPVKAGPLSHPERVRNEFAKRFALASKEREKLIVPPPGWWSLRGVHGSLTGVLRAIAESSIPEDAKVYLTSRVKERCAGDLNFVALDAHFHVEGGKENFHYTVECSKKLL